MYLPSFEPVPGNNSNNSTDTPLPSFWLTNLAVPAVEYTSPSLLTGSKKLVVTKSVATVVSSKSQTTLIKEVAPPAPDRTSAFRSTINPSEVVSQYISNKDSTGSVSYTAKNGDMSVDAPSEVYVAPIDFSVVDILAINGFVSI